jgi:hypothetical protein
MTAPIQVPPVPEETAPEAALEAAAAPAAATAKPARRALFRRPSNPWNLATVVAISFSLTFVGVSVALLMGVLPAPIASIQPPVDLGVLMLMVPLCALVFTMLAEVLLAAIRGLPRIRAPRPTPALSAWRPGHGEG